MAMFHQKLFVISGAASGIGRATAKLLASRGALLSLMDVNGRGLDAVEAEVQQINASSSYQLPYAANTGGSRPARVTTTTADVRSPGGCRDWIQRTVEHFGPDVPIHGAANLAGVTGKPRLTRDGYGEGVNGTGSDLVWDINVKGIVNCLQAQLPYLQQGKDGRGGAAIVNASSLSGLMGLPTYAPYVASKHAIIGISRTLAKEEGRNGIRVNAIAPAMIATPMLEEVASAQGGAATADMFGAGPSPALKRLGDADEVAELVAFLLSDYSSYISGTVIPIDGGMGA